MKNYSGKEIKLICISGVARAGKDTLCQMMIDALGKRGKTAKRFALADRLKSELYYFILSSFGVDIFKVDGEMKEVLRPILVAYGGSKRRLSKGKYWTEKLEDKIKADDTCDYAIVTDCRYTEYGDEDEIGWVRKNNGKLIHISRRLDDGTILEAPNEDERRNDPLLKQGANEAYTFGSLVNNKENMSEAKRQIELLVACL